MKKSNKETSSLKKLEKRFDRKLDWQFYIIMMVFLILAGGNYYLLKKFSNNLNEVIKFKPLEGVEYPILRSA